MPVQTTFSALSATAASNSPNQAEFKSVGDEYARQILAFLKSIYDNSGNGWTSPYLAPNGSGNYTIPSPSSGVALTVNGITGAVGAISVTDGTVTSVWQPNNTSIAHIGTTSNHAFNLMSNGVTHIAIAAAGNVTINAPSSGYALNLPTKTPSSATDTGTTGDISWDSSFIYVCTATNTWKRVAIATW